MPIIKLLHGSDHIIKTPKLSLEKEHNDYGRGFYCTKEFELAKLTGVNIRSIQL